MQHWCQTDLSSMSSSALFLLFDLGTVNLSVLGFRLKMKRLIDIPQALVKTELISVWHVNM